MRLPINYKESNWQLRKKARLQYIDQQNGLCHYCKCELTGPPSRRVLFKKINFSLFPKSMFNYPIHLHHCHKTHMTIGAVHAKCNAVLWQYHGE